MDTSARIRDRGAGADVTMSDSIYIISLHCHAGDVKDRYACTQLT